MQVDQSYVRLIQQEREREARERTRVRDARAHARAVRASRGPRFRPLRRIIGGWLVRAGLWLIAPPVCTDAPVSN